MQVSLFIILNLQEASECQSVALNFTLVRLTIRKYVGLKGKRPTTSLWNEEDRDAVCAQRRKKEQVPLCCPRPVARLLQVKIWIDVSK